MKLEHLDMNLLVVLDALLTERSVGGAAARLHVGQSTVSMALKRLRATLADPLFVKAGRGLRATPYAEALAQPLSEALVRLEGVLSVPERFDPARDSREFAVRMNDYAATVFVAPLLRLLEREAPAVRLDIQPVESDYARGLRRGDTDILVLPKEVFAGYREFPHRTLFTDRYVVAIDAENPVIGERITREQFSEMPYLAVRVGAVPSSAEMQLSGLGIERQTQVTVQSFSLVPTLLKGTRLISLLQERMVSALSASAGLRLLEPPVDLQPLHMLMLWSPDHDLDPAHRWLRERMAAFAGEILPDK